MKMSEFDVMKPISREDLKGKLIEHLVKYCDCSEENARIAVGEFVGPFHNLYLKMQPISDFTDVFQGEKYELAVAYTKEYVGNIYVKPQFTFFLFYRSSDVPNHTDEEYKKAKRIYMITDKLPFI